MAYDEATQEQDWQILHERITQTLDRYGKKDFLGRADYWLVDDNWGWRRHQLEFQNPNLLRPHIIRSLQALLNDFPR